MVKVVTVIAGNTTDVSPAAQASSTKAWTEFEGQSEVLARRRTVHHTITSIIRTILRILVAHDQTVVIAAEEAGTKLSNVNNNVVIYLIRVVGAVLGDELGGRVVLTDLGTIDNC